MLCVRSDDVLDSGVKLKEYLDDAINELSDDYINVAHAESDVIPKHLVLDLVQKHRNALVCMKEICKKRKKF